MLRWSALILFILPLLAGPAARAESRPRLPVLPNPEAWKRLPGAPEAVQPLPAWARMLAGPMPLTTARMLELDALHRSGDRLDARLRGLVRWAAADANGCAYSKSVAAADLRRAGVDESELETLAKHPERLPQLERAACAFARKMMREAHAVTDAEVKQLIDLAGEQRVVALVALLAHASFQDHLFLALVVPDGPDAVAPPVMATFAHPKAKPGPKRRPPEVRLPKNGTAGVEWLQLQAGLEKQRARPGRIRVPSREEVIRRVGPDHPAVWQAGINWSRVCYGNQPELTQAWFDCSDAFGQESGLDRLLRNNIFWVVTEALQCFY